MDNAQKAIMIGVGLFITIIVISAVLLIVNLGTDLVDGSTAELDTMSTAMQNELISKYDNKTISGSQVLSTIKKYENSSSICIMLCKKEQYNSYNLKNPVARVGAYYVPKLKWDAREGTTNKIGRGRQTYDNEDDTLKVFTGTTDSLGNGGGSYPKTNIEAFTNVQSKAYINTSKMYDVSLIEEPKNKAIVGIVFRPVFP